MTSTDSGSQDNDAPQVLRRFARRVVRGLQMLDAGATFLGSRARTYGTLVFVIVLLLAGLGFTQYPDIGILLSRWRATPATCASNVSFIYEALASAEKKDQDPQGLFRDTQRGKTVCLILESAAPGEKIAEGSQRLMLRGGHAATPTWMLVETDSTEQFGVDDVVRTEGILKRLRVHNVSIPVIEITGATATRNWHRK